MCREEWEKLPKYRSAKLVASYPRVLEAVIAAKGASTKYRVKCVNTDVNVMFFINLQKYIKPHFGTFIMGYCVLIDEGRK
jgi:hypothetical protein